ncbi:hypothetical protein [Candidatus Chazhemtobacterium aquaticus]|uniref:Polymerase nucleotidyl transferase domain-containing protein n=1 Tax=Candidatus Chazhemtobacterium aquaticus TaxID=2715735 RepID=A0A857N507_9BACT|nr:hypothetical protein [Candidatus Chazhemtobacterium aquaticus]QHO63217.1 hypothetical protein MICH65_0236 [Candidatus Chazhemtobacterium aquaticus]
MKPNLRSAIIVTLNYARFFDLPLNLSELHFWLIYPKTISKANLTRSLSRLPPSYTYNLDKPSLSLRRQRRQLTKQKLTQLSRHIHLLSYIPTIRLITLTGSLAVNNARPKDDIDLMIITTRHTLWLTRLLVTICLLLLGKKRVPTTNRPQPNTLCINLWLDTSSLAVPTAKRNLYTAHEVLQVKPLYDRHQTYQHFLNQNSWTSRYLANAYHHLVLSTRSDNPNHSSVLNDPWTHILLAPLNLIAFSLQYLYMKPKITKESISLHAAYFHPRNLSPRINAFLKSTNTN